MSTQDSLAESGLFTGGGELGKQMRAFDWVASPLGPVEDWPQCLRTALSLCLHSQFPIVLFCGLDLRVLYNDAYRAILADKHPEALGQPARQVFSEVWSIIGPLLQGVLQTGQATSARDLFLPLVRDGVPEECYFSFSSSPICDDTGNVHGVFCPVTETTDRVLGERRLRKLRAEAETARDQVTHILESITDGFYALDRQWRITYANPRAQELWGQPQGDFLGKNIWAEFPESEFPIFGEQLRKAMEERVMGECEGYSPPTGRWLALRAYPSAEGVAVYFQDITERKRAEVALRESEERQTFLLELSDALRPLTDADAILATAARVLGEHLRVNRACYVEVENGEDGEYFNIRPDYHTPDVSSIAGRFRVDNYGAALFDSLRAGRTISVADVEAEPLLTAAEREAYLAVQVRAHIAVPLVKGGRFAAVFGVHQTAPRAWTAKEIALVEETAERTWAAVERARAEAALRDSEQRWRTLAETLPALVWMARPDGFLDYYNQRWLDYTGMILEQLAGWGWQAVWHPEDLPDGRARWLESLRTGQPYEYEARFRRAADASYR